MANFIVDEVETCFSQEYLENLYPRPSARKRYPLQTYMPVPYAFIFQLGRRVIYTELFHCNIASFTLRTTCTPHQSLGTTVARPMIQHTLNKATQSYHVKPFRRRSKPRYFCLELHAQARSAVRLPHNFYNRRNQSPTHFHHGHFGFRRGARPLNSPSW
jgi:hypothetical protein